MFRPTRDTRYPIIPFQLRDFHPLRFTFPDRFVYKTITMTQVPLPPAMQGLGSSPFARRYSGNRFYFLFLRLLRCFSSPRMPPLRDVIALPITGCPIRILTGLSLLTARRDFSQLTTSFFATLCQGIHHVPLFPLILSLIHITHVYFKIYG